MTSLPRRVMSERDDGKRKEENQGMGDLAYMLIPAYFCVITHREIALRETQGRPMPMLEKAKEYGIAVAGEALKNGVYCYLAARYVL